MGSKALKTRFAPSPTGLLHLGNVRTALFNDLLARGAGGCFLLRLEDTDAVRGEGKYAEALQEDLRWLGLAWQEGPGRDGGHGPYVQSARGPLYQKYFDRLQEEGLAYSCFCSEHELKLARKAQLASGRPPRYSGRCYELLPEEVQARFAAGKPATLRFRVGTGGVVEFDDKVRGHQRFETDDIGDFVIRRSVGTPAFFFSNAVDDALMNVSLVMRGEDHLTNTPRQILLLQALGLPVPDYAHIALVVGADGAPLSKRNGSQTVRELREQGFLPLAIVNYLARLGHTYDENAFMSLEALAKNFNTERLHRAPARFDRMQLLHWQHEAIAQATKEELWTWMNTGEYFGARVADNVPRNQQLEYVRTIRENIETPADAVIWAGNLFSKSGLYDIEAKATIREAGAVFFQESLACLENGVDDFAAYSKALSKAVGAEGKALFMPLRAALTGEHEPNLESKWRDGPRLAQIWDLLGREQIRRRLQQAKDIAAAGA